MEFHTSCFFHPHPQLSQIHCCPACWLKTGHSSPCRSRGVSQLMASSLPLESSASNSGCWIPVNGAIKLATYHRNMSFTSLNIYSLAVFTFSTWLSTTKTINLRAGQLSSRQRLPTLQVRGTTGAWVCCKGWRFLLTGFSKHSRDCQPIALQTLTDLSRVLHMSTNNTISLLISAKNIFNEARILFSFDFRVWSKIVDPL